MNDLVSYCDGYLRIREIDDYENACNGLQLENSGALRKIAAAVDFSTRALEAAAESGANLLIVHHGMFWGGLRPITNVWRRQLKFALENDIAVYSAHLPLDLHPEVGNNILLARALGIEDSQPFFEEKGSLLGRRATVEIVLTNLVARLEKALDAPVQVICGGHGFARETGPKSVAQNKPARVRQIGVITGGAGGEIERVAAEGIDTFITGEAPHWAAVAAHDLKINFFVAGHYATEVFGVRALASHLSERFGIPHEFIDCPTGF